MSDTIIKIENLSKQYRLGIIGSKTLRGDFQRWIARMRGKEDPLLKIGDENKLNSFGGEYVWALKNINLEIKQGEVLGIIGKNGAGKSTLLKILSRVTGPTTGTIKINGRIASLLEVGTGFHPELTGRENIFLNGAILGMTRKEIKSKLDEIVGFAGVEKYMDTPVKRYSSGMYVRLAFAVAAHLDPDILVVDEVLAVGDAEFQKKALGKMEDVSKKEGRTVLFVSHNMQTIRQLCRRSILLKNGRIILDDNSDFVIDKYVQENFSKNIGTNDIPNIIKKIPNDPIFKLNDIFLTQNNQTIDHFIKSDKPLEIEFKYQILKRTTGFRIFLDLCDDQETLLFRSFNDEKEDDISVVKPGNYIAKAIIPPNFFAPRKYELKIQAGIYNLRYCLPSPIKISFQVEDTSLTNRAYLGDSIKGKIAIQLDWSVVKP